MKKIICYSPFNVSNNLYVENIKNLIGQEEFEVVPIKKCLKSLKVFNKCNIYNFNWFEKVEGKNLVHSYCIYFFKIALIKWLKFNRKKIIYTIHNKKPHNIKNDKLSIKMMNILCKNADVILGMCSDTEDVIKSIDKKYINKFNMVLHPNYINNYDINDISNYKENYRINESDLVFLFFGSISPYKNIEMLIKIFNELKELNIKLLIVGKPVNDQYKNKIVEIIDGNKNIIYDLRFIEEREVVKFYNTSDVVILPYKKESSLNSGAIYLSFSLKKTIISPKIGSVNSLNDKSFIYAYDYNSESEHYSELKKQIIKVYNDNKNDSECIVQYGKKAFNYVVENHSNEKIKSMYSDIYNKLI